MATSEPKSSTSQAGNRLSRTFVVGALAVVLGLIGVGTLAYVAVQQDDAPQPPAAVPSGSASGLPALPPSDAQTLPAATPTFIRIPGIDVASTVNEVGLNSDGTMEVPREGPRYDEAAWYRHSPTPGEVGPSVIIGHIDSAASGPSVFFELGRLTPGQRIEITRADDTTVTFEVDFVESYPKNAFPLGTVYGDTKDAALRLITCSGSFDSKTGQYRNNTVVFAHMVQPDR